MIKKLLKLFDVFKRPEVNVNLTVKCKVHHKYQSDFLDPDSVACNFRRSVD